MPPINFTSGGLLFETGEVCELTTSTPKIVQKPERAADGPSSTALMESKKDDIGTVKGDELGNWISNGIGLKLMQMMGYNKGEGLGKKSDGMLHSLPIKRYPRGVSLDVIMEHKDKIKDGKLPKALWFKKIKGLNSADEAPEIDEKIEELKRQLHNMPQDGLTKKQRKEIKTYNKVIKMKIQAEQVKAKLKSTTDSVKRANLELQLTQVVWGIGKRECKMDKNRLKKEKESMTSKDPLVKRVNDFLQNSEELEFGVVGTAKEDSKSEKKTLEDSLMAQMYNLEMKTKEMKIEVEETDKIIIVKKDAKVVEKSMDKSMKKELNNVKDKPQGGFTKKQRKLRDTINQMKIQLDQVKANLESQISCKKRRKLERELSGVMAGIDKREREFKDEMEKNGLKEQNTVKEEKEDSKVADKSIDKTNKAIEDTAKGNDCCKSSLLFERASLRWSARRKEV